MTMTNSTINLLAEETLLTILEHVRNSSKARELLPSLLACRRWNRIGTPVLYHDIRVHNADLTGMSAALNKHRHHVLTLSIQLTPCAVEMYNPEGQADYVRSPVEKNCWDAGSSATQILWKDLKSFASVLRGMQKLSTFSLTLESQAEVAATPGFWLDHSCVDALLESLALSVSALELDTQLFDRPMNKECWHLCPRLHQLLPQIVHLRLRIKTLCKELFGFHECRLTAPKLQSLVINTSLYVRTTLRCDREDKTGCRRGFNIMSLTDEGTSFWPSLCLQAVESGSCPKLNRFDVISFERADQSWRDEEGAEEYASDDDGEGLDRDALEADHHIQRDLLFHKTYRSPEKSVAEGSRSSMLRTRGHVEVFGGSYAIEQKVEGPAWVSTVGEIRFPASFAASNEAATKGYQWQSLDLDDREAFRKRSRFGLEVWDYESDDGEWVIDVEELDHV